MVKYVLILEGFGVRSLIGLEFLSKLESELGVPVSNQFDVFSGTNFGVFPVLGLASGLALEKLTNSLLSAENAQRMMTKASSARNQGLISSKPLYTNNGKDTLIASALPKILIHDIKKTVLVPLLNIETRELTMFSSDPELCHHNPKISDIATASTSLPIYFSPSPIELTQSHSNSSSIAWFIDGSIVCHDLLVSVIGAARKQFGDQEEIRVLVVGNGKVSQTINGQEASSFGGLDWIQHDLLGMATQTYYKTTSPFFTYAFPNTKILQVNINLGNVSDAFDDASTENLYQLKELGKTMFEQSKSQLINFMSGLEVPKDTITTTSVKKSKEKKPRDEEKKKKKKERKEEEERRRKEEEEEEKKRKEEERRKEEVRKSRELLDHLKDKEDSDKEDDDSDEEDEETETDSETKPEKKEDKVEPKIEELTENKEELTKTENQPETQNVNGKPKKKKDDDDDSDDSDDDEGCVIS